MEKPIVAYHPGEILKDELDTRGRTQKQFAELIGITTNEVNDIIKGRRNITARLAIRIGQAF
jgi:HTH-type transcriptional regulator/antitoxin HigA